jgi:hemerythrin
MPLIVWNDNLSIHIGEIDRQHQQLVKLVNELNDAMRQGKGKDVLSKTLSGLITYTATHFGTEERYFNQFEYPATADHKKEHRAFVAKVSNFKEKFEGGRVGLSIEIMNFLSDWLIKHIQGIDKQYAPFFKAHGLN